MVNMQPNSVSARKNAILDSAIGVFGRYGYKKTTVDDLAKAAGLSKQGLYLHFKSKDEVFVASFKKYLDDALMSVEEALEDLNSPFADRLNLAFDKWFGRHLETFRPESLDIIQAGERIHHDSVEKYKNLFKAKIIKAVSTSVEFKNSKSIASPKDIAQVLFLCGMSWKDGLRTRTQFREEMALSISVICNIKRKRLR